MMADTDAQGTYSQQDKEALLAQFRLLPGDTQSAFLAQLNPGTSSDALAAMMQAQINTHAEGLSHADNGLANSPTGFDLANGIAIQEYAHTNGLSTIDAADNNRVIEAATRLATAMAAQGKTEAEILAAVGNLSGVNIDNAQVVSAAAQQAVDAQKFSILGGPAQEQTAQQEALTLGSVLGFGAKADEPALTQKASFDNLLWGKPQETQASEVEPAHPFANIVPPGIFASLASLNGAVPSVDRGDSGQLTTQMASLTQQRGNDDLAQSV